MKEGVEAELVRMNRIVWEMVQFLLATSLHSMSPSCLIVLASASARRTQSTFTPPTSPWGYMSAYGNITWKMVSKGSPSTHAKHLTEAPIFLVSGLFPTCGRF